MEMVPSRAADRGVAYRAFAEPPEARVGAHGGDCTMEAPVALPALEEQRRVHVALAFDRGRGAVAFTGRNRVGIVPIGPAGARAGDAVSIPGAGDLTGAGTGVHPFERGWLVITAAGEHHYAYAFPGGPAAPGGGEIDSGGRALGDVAATPRGLEMLVHPDRVVTLRVGPAGLEQSALPITGMGGPWSGQVLADPAGPAWIASTPAAHHVVRPGGTFDLRTDVVLAQARFAVEGGELVATWGRDHGFWRVRVGPRGELVSPDRVAPAEVPLTAAIEETVVRAEIQRYAPQREPIGAPIELPAAARAEGAARSERALAFSGEAFVLAWSDGGGTISTAAIRCGAAR
jgi:hypothetical protein